MGTDPAIESHAMCHVADLGAGELADPADGVDEGNLHGQEGVGGMLGELGAGNAHFQVGAFRTVDDRLIDFPQEAGGPGGIDPDHDPVRIEGVLDGGSFPQEFGIGCDVEGNVGFQVFVEGPLELVVGIDDDRAFFHQQAISRHVAGDFPAHPFDVGHVGLPPVSGGRADGDEDDFGVLGSLADGGGETEAAGLHVLADEGVQSLLVNRHLKATQAGDLRLVVVHAQDIVADFRQGNAGHQSYVTGSYNGQLHRSPGPINVFPVSGEWPG